MSKIGLYDVVELVEDLPGTIFRAGMTGTVVETFKSGAFEWNLRNWKHCREALFPQAFGPINCGDKSRLPTWENRPTREKPRLRWLMFTLPDLASALCVELLSTSPLLRR